MRNHNLKQLFVYGFQILLTKIKFGIANTNQTQSLLDLYTDKQYRYYL
jgi:hypothetical protein